MRSALSTAIFGVTLIAATLAPSIGFAHSAFAPGAEPKQGVPPRLASTNLHKLAGSVIDAGNLDTLEPSGYSLIDSNTVDCKKASCTIAVDMQDQVGDNSSTGNWFAICAAVDGAFVSTGCPYSGEIPTDGSYVGSRSRQSFFGLAKGTHTVATYVYMLVGSAYSNSYDIEYNVLTP